MTIWQDIAVLIEGVAPSVMFLLMLVLIVMVMVFVFQILSGLSRHLNEEVTEIIFEEEVLDETEVEVEPGATRVLCDLCGHQWDEVLDGSEDFLLCPNCLQRARFDIVET